MIALTILATVLITLGGLMYSVARHTGVSSSVAYRNAAARKAVAWGEALPWDTVGSPSWAPPCFSDAIGPFAYDRCTTVSGTAQLRILTISINPTGAIVVMPDTVVVTRHRIRSTSPFK